MAKNPNYEIVEDNKIRLLLRDIGPGDAHLTITNGAEIVVKELANRVIGRRLEYIDSEGKRSQLVIDNGKFVGFASV